MAFRDKLQKLWGRMFTPSRFKLRSTFFFRTRQTIDCPSGSKRTLLVIKASDDLHPYIAVTTRTLGEIVVNCFSDKSALKIVCGAQLSIENDYFDFSTRKVCLLESEIVVRQFVADRTSFPYEKHIVELSA